MYVLAWTDKSERFFFWRELVELPECTLYKSEPLSQGWYHLDFFSVIPCFCCFISAWWG